MFVLNSINNCEKVITTGNICNDVEVLNVIGIIKSLVEIVTIIIPVILTIFVMVDIVKTVTSQDVDTKKLFKPIVQRFIAAVVIFLVPSIINFVVGIIPNEKFYYVDCWENAEKDKILEIASENAIASEAHLVCILENATPGNEEHYNAAYQAYEQLRVDIKAIPTDKDKSQLERNLEYLKTLVDKLKPQK